MEIKVLGLDGYSQGPQGPSHFRLCSGVPGAWFPAAETSLHPQSKAKGNQAPRPTQSFCLRIHCLPPSVWNAREFGSIVTELGKLPPK